ncbi:porin family protein [Pedobacter sp. BMA]|uniref:porin family protein n=1 Tax=Pedobacter sp. BMA TaxID=1663685 RepID=UPI0006496778|nr:porin family protein [Pedobacter sp. BMA]KLT65115.1 hypothetical protein AB669_15580 [Pedobacter sp. BMA]
MKKLATILILSFITIGTWAQNSPLTSYGFRLGLTATPTVGWIKPEQGKTNGLSLGFSYGLMGDFNFAPNYSFSTALTITTINGKSTEANVSPYQGLSSSSNPKAYDLKYKLQYVDLPLTIKLKTVKANDTRWYGQFGLSNSINIGAKQDAVSNGVKVADDTKISDQTSFYRAGLIIGGGGEFDISGNASIMAGLTFNNGFTNIVSDGSRTVKNHYIALNFGVFF